MTGGFKSSTRLLGWECYAAEFATREEQQWWELFLGIDGIDGFSYGGLTAAAMIASKVTECLLQKSFERVVKASNPCLLVLSSQRYMTEEDFRLLSDALQPVITVGSRVSMIHEDTKFSAKVERIVVVNGKREYDVRFDFDGSMGLALTVVGHGLELISADAMGLYAFTPVVLDCKSNVTYPPLARGKKMVDRKCQNPECAARVKRGEKGLCPRSIWKQEFGRDWPPAHASGVLNAYHGWGKQSDKMLELISFVPMVHGTSYDGEDEEQPPPVAYSRTNRY